MEGYTYVLVYERGLEFMLENNRDRMTDEVLESFLETMQELQVVSQTPDKVYTIYRIP